MEIAFASRQLRSLFESDKLLKAKFNGIAAEALMTFFSELKAANEIEEMVGYGIEFHSAPKMTIRISPELSINIEANHTKLPIDKTGSIIWSRIYMIKVMSVQYES